MKRILTIFALLALVSAAWAAMADLKVGTGTPELTLGAGDAYITDSLEVDGIFLPNTGTAFVPDDVTPTVAAGNVFFTGANTGATAITDIDNPVAGAVYIIVCGSIAGGNQSTIADGGNFALEGPWNPITVGDSLWLYCVADNNYIEIGRGHTGALADPVLFGNGLIGTPGLAAATDPGLGWYVVAPGILAFVDGGAEIWRVDAANGITATAGINATPIGAVAPAQISGTDYHGTGSMHIGTGPGAMFTGPRRTDRITDIDDFRGGVDATYGVKYNIAGVVGAGTNTVTVRDGWSELVTGGAGGPDMESTVTVGLDYLRAYAPRAESMVDLASVAGQRFEWGFYAGANERVEIVFDTAVGANWLLQVGDGAAIETIDSGIPATVDPTKLEISVATDGTVTWAIDGAAMTVVGLTHQMTANPEAFRWMLTDIAAAVHTAAVDYIEIERNKR